jgi:hypothetical protein
VVKQRDKCQNVTHSSTDERTAHGNTQLLLYYDCRHAAELHGRDNVETAQIHVVRTKETTRSDQPLALPTSVAHQLSTKRMKCC